MGWQLINEGPTTLTLKLSSINLLRFQFRLPFERKEIKAKLFDRAMHTHSNRTTSPLPLQRIQILTQKTINKNETISLTGAHSVTQLVSISAFYAQIRPVAITANAGFIAIETRERSFAIDAKFVLIGASFRLDALVDVEASFAVLHEPAVLAFGAAFSTRSRTSAVTRTVTLRAQ